MEKIFSIRGAVFVLMGLIYSGCSSTGFNRGELKDQVGIAKPSYDEKEIKDAYNKKPNLPKPFKLAIYFKAPIENGNRQSDWRWTEQDKLNIEEIAKDLKAQGLISDVFPITGSVVKDESLKSLRLVAAMHQADAILIVGGAGQIDRYINHLGWSYIFLVPAFFIPGSIADTLFITSASLWDVKNEFLYVTAEAEAVTTDNYIAAFGKSNKERLEEAKAQSISKLKDEIKKQIQGTKISY